MKRKHEQSVIDGFSRHLEKKADAAGRRFVRCSLDGQDSILGGDYIFTTNTRFVLLEFKFEEADLMAEAKKPLRNKLCVCLEHNPNRLKQSLQCHFIGWSRPNQTRSVYFNQYHPEICNTSVFKGDSRLPRSAPDLTARVPSSRLISDFLNQQLGGVYVVFKSYIEWLLSLAGEDGGSIELMVDDPESDDLRLLDFSSFPEMKQWLDQHKPPNEPRPRHGPSM